jgi:hypothetical protein
MVNVKLTVTNKIMVRGAPIRLIETLKDHLTMPNPAFAEAKKRGRWTGNIEKVLRFYTQDADGISFPRGYARQAIELIEQHTGRKPQIIDKRRSCPQLDLSFHGELRPYQKEAVRDILARDFGVMESAWMITISFIMLSIFKVLSGEGLGKGMGLGHWRHSSLWVSWRASNLVKADNR